MLRTTIRVGEPCALKLSDKSWNHGRWVLRVKVKWRSEGAILCRTMSEKRSMRISSWTALDVAIRAATVPINSSFSRLPTIGRSNSANRSRPRRSGIWYASGVPATDLRRRFRPTICGGRPSPGRWIGAGLPASANAERPRASASPTWSALGELIISQGAIAAARTMGARCFRSGSWRRSGRR